MSNEITTEFLPLGSVLRLQATNDDACLYFIVARAIAKNEREEIVSRYKVAPHPFGDTPSQEVFSIDVEQIVEVVFKGYADNNDSYFLNELLEKMATGSEPSMTIQITEDVTREVVLEEKLQQISEQDPFYLFR